MGKELSQDFWWSLLNFTSMNPASVVHRNSLPFMLFLAFSREITAHDIREWRKKEGTPLRIQYTMSRKEGFKFAHPLGR